MISLRAAWLGFVLAFCTLACAGPAAAAPTFPPLTGRVVDQAGILSASTEASLTARLEQLEASTSRQLVVVTVSSLQGLEIEEYGYQLGRAWGIGQAKTNTGVLLLVAPAERRVRIEVGYGLEPVLTDALSRSIIETTVLPLFRQGQMEDGIVAGVDKLVEQLSLPQAEAEARAKIAGDNFDWALPVAIAFLIVIWIAVGATGMLQGRGPGGWLWPLFVIMRSGASGRGDGFHGGGGSFGGGGASGRW